MHVRRPTHIGDGRTVAEPTTINKNHPVLVPQHPLVGKSIETPAKTAVDEDRLFSLAKNLKMEISS